MIHTIRISAIDIIFNKTISLIFFHTNEFKYSLSRNIRGQWFKFHHSVQGSYTRTSPIRLQVRRSIVRHFHVIYRLVPSSLPVSSDYFLKLHYTVLHYSWVSEVVSMVTHIIYWPCAVGVTNNKVWVCILALIKFCRVIITVEDGNGLTHNGLIVCPTWLPVYSDKMAEICLALQWSVSVLAVLF